MDWDKVIETVLNVAKKVLTLARSLILIMSSCAFVYIAFLALVWVVAKAHAVFCGGS